jgi:hypothetical protein
MLNYPTFVWNHTTTTDMILENRHVLSGRNWTNNYRRKEGLRKRSNLNRSFVHNIFSIIVINIWILNSNTWNLLCLHSPHHVKSKTQHLCNMAHFRLVQWYQGFEEACCLHLEDILRKVTAVKKEKIITSFATATHRHPQINHHFQENWTVLRMRRHWNPRCLTVPLFSVRRSTNC